jgi:hypothetical protein
MRSHKSCTTYYRVGIYGKQTETETQNNGGRRILKKKRKADEKIGEKTLDITLALWSDFDFIPFHFI